MPVFDSFGDQNNGNFNGSSIKGYDFTDKKTKGLFLSRVFGMMFLCLVITTVVAAGFGYGFQAYLLNGATLVDGNLNLDSNSCHCFICGARLLPSHCSSCHLSYLSNLYVVKAIFSFINDLCCGYGFTPFFFYFHV